MGYVCFAYPVANDLTVGTSAGYARTAVIRTVCTDNPVFTILHFASSATGDMVACHHASGRRGYALTVLPLFEDTFLSV